MKKLNKIKKTLITVASLIIVIVIGLVIKNSLADPNSGYLRNQLIDGLSFKNADIKYVDGITTFTVEVHNENEEDYRIANDTFKIKISDRNNNTTTLIGYVGKTLKAGDSVKVVANTDNVSEYSFNSLTSLEYEFLGSTVVIYK